MTVGDRWVGYLPVLAKRKLLFAIAIGAVLAGLPMVTFNVWLSGFIEREIREAVETPARRHLNVIETGIAGAIKSLDELTALGVNSCSPSDLDALRQATFTTIPVKEFSIVAADGRTLCATFDGYADRRQVLSSESLAPDRPDRIEIVQIGSQGVWVRFHRPGTRGGNGIAALIPVAFFAPQVIGNSPFDQVIDFYAQIRTWQGTVVATAGAITPDVIRGDTVTSQQRSNRFSIQSIVTVSRALLLREHNDLRMFALIFSVLLVALMIAAGVLLRRRRYQNNPVAEIARALDAGEFVPYYQPIVDIRSGRLRGAEVLVRWRKPDGTIIPPGAFIPLAESSGIIVDMTRVLMRKVCAEMGDQLGKRPHLSIAFNVTAHHLSGEDIVDDLRSIFRRSPIRLSQVTLELTENYPIESLAETRQVVAAIQGLGCKVAIDDVGTGHSGLSYLLKLGVDVIKIDKLFIDSIGIDRHSSTIVETLIDLALNMRIDVVAEGVESFEQVEQLREMGVRAAQGYVFAPPLPGPSFMKLVEAIDPVKDEVEAEQAEGTGTEKSLAVAASL